MHARSQARALASIIMLLASTVLAWQAQDLPSQEPAATIRVNTRLVLVDVVVTDKQGHRLTGLKPQDFTLQERGKTQKIAFFSTPQQAQQHAEPAQLGPGIYSNKPEYRSSGGPIVAMVLDGANTPFKDQAYARLQMLKYVREQFKPDQRMAIFALTGSLGVLQDFTTDPQVLIAALQKFRPQEPAFQAPLPPPLTSAGLTAPGTAAAAAIARAEGATAAFESAQVYYALESRVQSTLQGMRSLARILGGLPGRKQIIWLTAAFPFELIPENRNVSDAELLADLPTIDIRQKNVDTRAVGSYAATERGLHAQEIRAVAAQMANAQIAVYPVDVRGLASGIEFQREDSANRQAQSLSLRAIVRMDDVSASQQTMREMAAETGGQAYVNQNEIRAGVALALADNGATYTLGYYPEDKKWDGAYRSLKVKVNRDGAEARYRRGYFAIDPTRQKDKKSDQAVAEALRDGMPATQVTFSAQVKPGENGKLQVSFLVDPNTVSAEDASGGSKKINFVLYAAAFSPEGKMLTSHSIKVDQTFDAATYQKIIQQGGMLVPMELDATPGKNALRLAVQDVRTGLVGSINAETP